MEAAANLIKKIHVNWEEGNLKVT